MIANPLLWHLVDAGMRMSLETGRPQQGEGVLRQLSRRVDDATARVVFKVSGLYDSK